MVNILLHLNSYSISSRDIHWSAGIFTYREINTIHIWLMHRHFCKLTVNACNGTSLMHCLSSVYWATTPLHVSGLLVAHHQEVTMYIRGNWYVLYVLVDCRRAWMEWQSKQPDPSTVDQDVQHIPIVAYIHCYLLIMGYKQVRNM
jgi:hypothetical protein